MAWRKSLLLLAALLLLLPGLRREWPVSEGIKTAAPGSQPPLFYVRPSQKALALTFDVSWGETTLPQVLRILAETKTRATFFLSGPWARHHPELVRAIAAQGHEIASHGEEHVNLSQYSASEVRENLRRSRKTLEGLTGQPPVFFRPPNGDYDDLVVSLAREEGMETVIWSVDSLDWKNPGADYMVRRVLELAFPGAIVLFHASDSSRQIAEALEPVIQALRSRGYELLPLGELYRLGSPGRDDPRGNPDYPPVSLGSPSLGPGQKNTATPFSTSSSQVPSQTPTAHPFSSSSRK